jgi:hypothetical protein
VLCASLDDLVTAAASHISVVTPTQPLVWNLLPTIIYVFVKRIHCYQSTWSTDSTRWGTFTQVPICLPAEQEELNQSWRNAL